MKSVNKEQEKAIANGIVRGVLQLAVLAIGLWLLYKGVLG